MVRKIGMDGWMIDWLIDKIVRNIVKCFKVVKEIENWKWFMCIGKSKNWIYWILKLEYSIRNEFLIGSR